MQRIRVLKLPMARRRLTTVPGPDPVMPAAHERASTDAHWSSCCTTPELGRSSRRWPNRRRVYAGTRQAAATAERPTSCHILGLEVAQRKKDLASRPSAACADAQVCRVTGRVAPSSFPKLALVFCSVSERCLRVAFLFYLRSFLIRSSETYESFSVKSKIHATFYSD